MPVCERCDIAFLEGETHVCVGNGRALSTRSVMMFFGRLIAAVCVPFLGVVVGSAIIYNVLPSPNGVFSAVVLIGGPVAGFLLLPDAIRKHYVLAALVYFPIIYPLLVYFAITYAGNVYHRVI